MTCSSAADTSGFSCSAALSGLSNGAHMLQVATFVVSGNSIFESDRSDVLNVVVAAASATAVQSQTLKQHAAPAGEALRAEQLLDGWRAPVDAAFSNDGTLFVGERGGTVTTFAGQRASRSNALFPDEIDPERPQLLSLTLDPNYVQSRLVFAAYGISRGEGAVLQLVRYRDVRGQLGERAVIFQTQTSIPASTASAVIRFGPDGKLYVAFGAAEGNGWLMRLNPDGTTPGDAARASREILTGVQAPRGLDWDPSSQGLWLADENRTDSRLSTMATTAAPVRAVVRGWRQLSGRAGPLTFYRSDAIPGLRGDAVMGSADGQLLRIRFDPADRTRVEAVETLFDPNAGPVRALAVSPDGALYFVTDSELGRLTVNGSARTSGH